MDQHLTGIRLLAAAAACACLSPAFGQSPPSSTDIAELWCMPGAGEQEEFALLDEPSELTPAMIQTSAKRHRDAWRPKETIICESGRRLSAK